MATWGVLQQVYHNAVAAQHDSMLQVSLSSTAKGCQVQLHEDNVTTQTTTGKDYTKHCLANRHLEAAVCHYLHAEAPGYDRPTVWPFLLLV